MTVLRFAPQIGHLEVVTPPEIDDAASTSDVVVTEGSPAHLRCRAVGNPQPEITWKREDGAGILISDGITTTSGTPLSSSRSGQLGGGLKGPRHSPMSKGRRRTARKWFLRRTLGCEVIKVGCKDVEEKILFFFLY